MPHKIKVEAKEVALAIEKGLKELGLRRDQVEVTVLQTPKKGFLGLGARPAVVEVRQKRWASGNLDAQIYMDVPKKKRQSGNRSSSRTARGAGSRYGKKDETAVPVRGIKRGGRKPYAASRRRDAFEEKLPKTNEPQQLPSLEIQNAVVPEYLKAPLQEAKDYLNNVLTHMGVKVENLHSWWDEKQHRILLTFDCDHPAIVIGKEGKTLESLQYLATLSLSRHFDKPISVIADTQNYWRKAEDKINADLEYGINQIKNGHSVYRFRPMSAQLRRYVHRAAENNEFVVTVSEGEGQWRKVTLRPRPADQPVKNAPKNKMAGAQTAAASELPKTEPVTDDAQGGTCQAELARNCAEGEVQVGCGCSPIFETTQEAAKTADNAVVQTEQNAPAVQPDAAAQNQAAGELPQTQSAADDAQGGTCYAGIARNCAEDEVQVGCACEPLFETPKQTEEVSAVQPEAENPAQNGEQK